VRFDAVTPADAAVFSSIAALGGTFDKNAFVPAVPDFYFTNPIARASRVMAECSALARGVQREAAE
jgi:NADH-quinone oxidoreductase subunit G